MIGPRVREVMGGYGEGRSSRASRFVYKDHCKVLSRGVVWSGFLNKQITIYFSSSPEAGPTQEKKILR